MAASPPGASPAPRNRYADLLRVMAITMVVLGHWLLTSISAGRGLLTGIDAMSYIGWSGWGTLLFQVMPVFFLVGGYANALSWTRHHAEGADWAWWVRHRAIRLLRPISWYVAALVVAVAACRLAGAGAAELAQAGWAVALQLWFLPVYLLLIALTPALHAAHRRFGLAVPAVMLLGVAAVDACLLGAGLSAVGYANYLLVWGCIHQWGFAWQDGTWRRRRWRPYALAAGGAAVLGCLLAWGPFSVNMVNNAVPPSVPLLAFAAVQAGLLLAAEPAASRLLARASRPWRAVSWLNDRVLTVYLWHMVPVIIVAVALYPTGIMPQPAINSAGWWALRPAWIAALAVVLAPAALWLARLERPLPVRPAPRAGMAPQRARGPAVAGAALTAAGVAAAGVALARVAVGGFAPGGDVPGGTIALYAAGVILTVLAGRLAYGRPKGSRIAAAAAERPAYPAR
jgi:fucose 4-O-acetylase-like acetyltransferase